MKREWTKEDLELLKQLRLEGNTLTKIKEEYFPDVCIATLHNQLKKMGLAKEVKSTSWTEVDTMLLKKLYNEKFLAVEDIATQMGFSVSIIKKQIKILNKEITNCLKCGSKIDLNNSNLCKQCKKILENRKKTEDLMQQDEQRKNEIIQRYKIKHKERLSFCKKCNEKKDINKDYFYSVKDDGTVWCYCKKCNIKRTKENRLKNLEERGF